jgi:hypothetical protein
MVRAILEGRKTQTRRVVKDKYLPWLDSLVLNFLDGKWNQRPLPYGKPGDRLWVRETWFPDPPRDGSWASTEWAGCGCVTREVPPPFRDSQYCIYKADDGIELSKWKPSIHMPRWASRITLEVKAVRVERLQDISADDALAEGIPPIDTPGAWTPPIPASPNLPATYCGAFCKLWGSINGPGSWDANPWVWVIEFERIK